MTRETAIDLLDNLKGMIEDSQGNDYDKAFRMAIESLKQIDEIKKIISADVYIQEDVLRYKMICEVVK